MSSWVMSGNTRKPMRRLMAVSLASILEKIAEAVLGPAWIGAYRVGERSCRLPGPRSIEHGGAACP
jgi:hypothetical protein